jgi:hypothetical protein
MQGDGEGCSPASPANPFMQSIHQLKAHSQELQQQLVTAEGFRASLQVQSDDENIQLLEAVRSLRLLCLHTKLSLEFKKSLKVLATSIEGTVARLSTRDRASLHNSGGSNPGLRTGSAAPTTLRAKFNPHTPCPCLSVQDSPNELFRYWTLMPSNSNALHKLQGTSIESPYQPPATNLGGSIDLAVLLDHLKTDVKNLKAILQHLPSGYNVQNGL